MHDLSDFGLDAELLAGEDAAPQPRKECRAASAVAGAGVVTAAIAGGVAAGTGFGAVGFAVLVHAMTRGHGAFTIRAGTGGFSSGVHRCDI